MIEELKMIEEKVQNRRYNNCEEYINDYKKINFDIEKLNTVEELEEVEQLLLRTKLKYNFENVYNFYSEVIEKIKNIENLEYFKQIEQQKQKEKNEAKKKNDNIINLFTEKLKKLGSKTIIDNIENNPFIKFKGYKITKNNDGKITIKEKNKNILKNVTIYQASIFLAKAI